MCICLIIARGVVLVFMPRPWLVFSITISYLAARHVPITQYKKTEQDVKYAKYHEV